MLRDKNIFSFPKSLLNLIEKKKSNFFSDRLRSHMSRVQLLIFLASSIISEIPRQRLVSGGPNAKPLRVKLFFHDSKD